MNGMPHLAYLGQILEKEEGFAVIVGQSTQMASFIVLNVFGKFFVISTNTHITLLCMTGRYGVQWKPSITDTIGNQLLSLIVRCP